MDEHYDKMINVYEEALQRYMGHGITALFNALVITFLFGFFLGAVVSIGIFAFQMNKTQKEKNRKLSILTYDLIESKIGRK